MNRLTACRDPNDVIFMLDSSGSIRESNFNQIKQFLRHFTSEVNVKSCNWKVGILKYGSSPEIVLDLNQGIDNLNVASAIDKLQYGYGYTDTATALQVVRKYMFTSIYGDRKNARNVLIVITDGISNVLTEKLAQELRIVEAEQLHIIPVGVAFNNKADLRYLATDKKKGIFYADNYKDLDLVKPLLLDYVLEGTAF